MLVWNEKWKGGGKIWSKPQSCYIQIRVITDRAVASCRCTLGSWISYLKINVCHCDLYFMFYWFCLVPWRLFDVWTSLVGIRISMTRHWPQNKCRSVWRIQPIIHGLVILRYILKTICFMNIIHVPWDYVSVWPDVWPQIKYMSLWSIFHGPVILPLICHRIYLMDECHIVRWWDRVTQTLTSK